MDWLYIEINAGDLLWNLNQVLITLKHVPEAIIDCMLEGDAFIVEPTKESR